MPEKIEFLKQIVQTLNSGYFRTKLNECESFSSQEKLVSTAFEFLIATKDFDLLEKYINEQQTYEPGNYDSIKKFIMKEKNLPEEVIDEELINNVINNGYLFHGTDISNNVEILKNGLLPPYQCYSEEFLEDISNVNYTYQSIYNNNNYYNDTPIQLHALDPIHVNTTRNDKFKYVYLTPSINISFLYSSNANEWIRLYIKTLLGNFSYSIDNIKWDDVDEIAKTIKEAINNSGVKVYEEEQQVFIDFLYKYYPKNNITNSDETRSIIFVPYAQSIIGTELIHNIANNKEQLKAQHAYNVKSIFSLAFNYNETRTPETINAENLAILEMSHNKELTLKTNKTI